MIPKNNIIIQYLVWRFFDVPRNIIQGWKNYLAFNLKYFSIPLLFKTMFAYWHKYSMSYGKGFDFQRIFEAITLNIMSRILGAIVRLFLIAIGLVFELLIFLVGLAVLLLWLFLPVIMVGGVIFAINFLF